METVKNLHISGDFEELKKKVIELTQNDFKWAVECQSHDKDGKLIDTKLLTISDFSYKNDIEDNMNSGILYATVTFENLLSEEKKEVEEIRIGLVKYDTLFKDGFICIRTKNKFIFNAVQSLFKEMDLI